MLSECSTKCYVAHSAGAEVICEAAPRVRPQIRLDASDVFDKHPCICTWEWEWEWDVNVTT